jgi:hypothetical protein
MGLEMAASRSAPNVSSSSRMPPKFSLKGESGLELTATFLEMMTLSTRVDLEVITDFKLPALLDTGLLFSFAQSLDKPISTLDAQLFIPLLMSGLLLSEK